MTDCPKKIWVISTLSDDELHEAGAEIPAMLQFHLQRCESCRAVAHRLTSTSRLLAAMNDEAADRELVEQGNARVTDAIRCGAWKNVGPDENNLSDLTWGRRRRWGPLALAATLFLAIGLPAFFWRSDAGKESTGLVEQTGRPDDADAVWPFDDVFPDVARNSSVTATTPDKPADPAARFSPLEPLPKSTARAALPPRPDRNLGGRRLLLEGDDPVEGVGPVQRAFAFSPE